MNIRQGEQALPPRYALPLPLILLVHLHILEYPHANKPEYDHNLFEPQVRGLRDRIKSMEDICFFLVGRIEGNSVRTLLSTYPCGQPSDTVAFRTSLAKYLESLRHQALYPSSKSAPVASSSGNVIVAWWWKDVIVRKSLLEECGGNRFERLLLSVSTHALMKAITKKPPIGQNDADSLIDTIPRAYAVTLAKCLAEFQQWSTSSSLMIQRRSNLLALRDYLSRDAQATSKYATLSTDRLSTLKDLKLQAITSLWHGERGHRALVFLSTLMGLSVQNLPSETGKTSEAPADTIMTQKPIVSPPLPVAAAHHPSKLKKLRRRIFSTKRVPLSASTADPPSENESFHGISAQIVLAGQLEATRRTRAALRDALLKTKKRGEELNAQMQSMKNHSNMVHRSNELPKLKLPSAYSHHTLHNVNFATAVSSDLLPSSSSPSSNTRTLEERIDHIRQNLLPKFPPVPAPLAPWKVPNSKPQTRIPRTASINKPPLGSDVLASVAERPQPRVPSIQAIPGPSKVTNAAPAKGSRRTAETPRKSIRFSIANGRKSSMFPDQHTPSQVEADKIIEDMESADGHASDEDFLVAMTPKPGNINRIVTSGTRDTESTAKRPKYSFPMPLHSPGVALPSLLSDSPVAEDLLDYGPDEGWSRVISTNPDLDPPTTISEADIDDDENEGFEYEGHSMTLRDILLRADTTQFDLLDSEEDDLADESFEWE